MEASLVTYNAATSACEKAGVRKRKRAEWQQALQLLQEVGERELQKDAEMRLETFVQKEAVLKLLGFP